jgi:putative membrane protein
MTSALLAFLHHAAAFLLFGTLVAELVLTKSELTLTSARSLLRMDAAYGISAMLLIVVGLLRVFFTEKGASYYFGSAPFLVKITLFVIVGLLSIKPTREFLSWRSTLAQQQLPAFTDEKRQMIRRMIHIELTLLVIIMLCAALMARGIGFFG